MITEDIKELIHIYTKAWHDIDELIPFRDNPTALAAEIDVYKSVISDLEKLMENDNDIRPHGEWIDNKDEPYYPNCSCCGYQIDIHENRGYFPFCPYCGADMRGRK